MNDDHFYFDENENKFYSSKGGKSYEDIFNDIKEIKEEQTYYKVENVLVTFSKNSKKIKLIGKEKTTEIFVVNANQVLFLLNHFNYKHYLIDGKNPREININDNLNFQEIKWLDNLLFQNDYDKANEIIQKNEKILLEQLSLLYYDYQKIKSNKNAEFILTNERKNFFEKLYKLNQTRRFIPICGPKSIGKTTSLLYYLKIYARMKYFYINLKYCQKLISQGKKEEFLLCICKELFNCMKFDDVVFLYKTLNEKNYVNIMDIVLDIFNYMSKNFHNNKYYIVLDQYKEKIDKNYEIIKKIELKTKVENQFDVFICSSINEFDFRNSLNKKIENSDEFYLNYLFINKLISVNKQQLISELNNEEIQLLDEAGNLYLYYYQIRNNKLYEQFPIEKKRIEIINHIIEEINDYFNENDCKKKISIIREIHDNIKKEKKLFDFKDKLSLIPFKYFNLLINNQNMFIIEDLKQDTKIIIEPCYPIVIDCINEIFQNSKYELKKSSSNETTENVRTSKLSSELEEYFNDYMWFYKNKFFFHGCKIIDKIKIKSLLEMDEADGKIIKDAADNLKIINESILITQKHQNAKHYDTAILKLIKIEDKKKIFELYLFQETINKDANERLFNSKLLEDRTSLKFKLYIISDVKIENVYFSYVFDKNNLDNATINYCQDLNINYLIFDDNIPSLSDSNINPLITPKFEFPLQININSNILRQEYKLNIIDVDYSKDKKTLIEEEGKLKDFLNKKRKLIEAKPNELSLKINKSKDYVNNKNRNYEIEDNLAQDYLLENNNGKIVGISYLIDKETRQLIKDLDFKIKEKEKLFEHMKSYNKNSEILKIIKLNGITSINIPNYDCCILQNNIRNEKIFIDIVKKLSYSLKNKENKASIDFDGDFYLIKFANKNNIFEK